MPTTVCLKGIRRIEDDNLQNHLITNDAWRAKLYACLEIAA